jgi:hypothetical protein
MLAKLGENGTMIHIIRLRLDALRALNMPYVADSRYQGHYFGA